MTKLLVRRLVAVAPVVLIVTIIAFLLVHLVPGDPAVLLAGDNATVAQIEAVRERLGLNQSLTVQYGVWLRDAVVGDFGTSLYSSLPVMEAIFRRIPVTLSLTGAAVVLALLVGVPAGTVAALRPGTLVDRVTTFVATLGIAVPNFWLGLLLLLPFALNNPWLPATGYVAFSEDPGLWLRHIILPAVTLAAPTAAEIARQTRSSVMDSLGQDYVRTAAAKGLLQSSVIGKHTLKNAAIPVVTVLGLQVGRLISGTIVVETVFALPGFGSLALQAVYDRDFPMIQGVIVVTTLLMIAVNLLVDMSYGYFNPKVRQA